MTERSQIHPADKLAVALERSSGLLATIADLYDTDRERFVGGEAFAVHAVSTAATLINEAKNALADLHYSCDLTMLDSTEDNAPTVDIAQVRDNKNLFSPAPAMAMQEPTPGPKSDHAPAPQAEEFAQSYLELLNKLTAAEIFAAEQQALSAPGAESELLPLLKSLREDLQKIHNAA